MTKEQNVPFKKGTHSEKKEKLSESKNMLVEIKIRVEGEENEAEEIS